MKIVIVRYAAIVLFFGLSWAILYPVYQRALENSKPHSCQSNLKQLGLAIRQYNQDYDDRMPPIRFWPIAESLPPFKKPYGWADALYPYVKSLPIYQCWQEEHLKDGAQDAVATQFTDYYYNTNLDGIGGKSILSPAETILLGEGNDGTDGTDARYNRNVIPKAWLTNKESPARRHLDGANYVFNDGHVKWVKPEQVRAERVSKNAYSFAVH